MALPFNARHGLSVGPQSSILSILDQSGNATLVSLVVSGLTTLGSASATTFSASTSITTPTITASTSSLGAMSGTSLSISGSLNTNSFTVNTDKFVVTSAGNVSVAGTQNVVGDFSVNTNKFNVAASSGNTTIAGTLGVTGTTTLSAVTVSGNSSLNTLAVAGDIAVNTNKFNVAASSGNTTIAGTLGVTGTTTLVTLNATTVTATTVTASNLSYRGSISSSATQNSTLNTTIQSGMYKTGYGLYKADNATQYKTGNWHLINLANDVANGNAAQLAVSNSTTPQMFVRSSSGTTWTEWANVDTALPKNISTSYYANSGEMLSVTADCTIYLPNTPAENERVVVIKSNSSSVGIVINPQSKAIVALSGAGTTGETLTLDRTGFYTIEFRYSSYAGGWVVS